MRLQRILLIPDTHRPFHDAKSYSLMLRVAKDFAPDEIVILGDYADFYSVSSHQKDPRLPTMLQEELADVHAGLRELRKKFPKSKIKYIIGNHEDRLGRYVATRCPELLETLDVRDMLYPDRLSDEQERAAIEFISYGPSQSTIIGKSRLRARHEPLGASPKATLTKSLCSIVYGHIHRIEETYSVGIDGKPITAFSVGWLGDRKHSVFSYVKNHHQWQMGFGLVYIDPKTKEFYHQKIHIHDNHTCLFNGKLYK